MVVVLMGLGLDLVGVRVCNRSGQ